MQHQAQKCKCFQFLRSHEENKWGKRKERHSVSNKNIENDAKKKYSSK